MKTDSATLARLYDRLAPKERAQLMLDAAARRDDVECDRLERTCPLRTHFVPDLDVTDRLRGALQTASDITLFWVDISHRLLRVRSGQQASAFLSWVHMDAAMLAGRRARAERARHLEECTEWETVGVTLKQGFESSARQWRAYEAALGRITAETGVAARHLRGLFEPFWDTIEEAGRCIPADVVAEAADTEKVYATFGLGSPTETTGEGANVEDPEATEVSAPCLTA